MHASPLWAFVWLVERTNLLYTKTTSFFMFGWKCMLIFHVWMKMHAPPRICLDRAKKRFQLCWVFFSEFYALFTRPANILFNKKNFKIRFYSTIHAFKNYFATIFSVFSFLVAINEIFNLINIHFHFLIFLKGEITIS